MGTRTPLHTRWSRPVHYGLLVAVHAELFIRPFAVGRYSWQLSFHPWADALRRIMVGYGQFPWWIPWQNGGVPLFADPEVAVFSPDTVLALIFGAVLGPKLAVLAWTLIGYEGARALCRHLFATGARRDGGSSLEGTGSLFPDQLSVGAFCVWVSVIPVLMPALAEHLGVGHYSFTSVHLFPWLLLLSLTWRRGVGRSLGLGLLTGSMLVTYLHYTTMMGLTLAGIVIAVQLARGAGRRRTWALLGLAVTTALGLSLMRIVVAAQWVLPFPRRDHLYPIAVNLPVVLRTLFEPFRAGSNIDIPVGTKEINWTELGSYVGVFAFSAFLIGLRDWRRQPPASSEFPSPLTGEGKAGGGNESLRWESDRNSSYPPHPDLPPQGGKGNQHLRLAAGRFFRWRLRWWHVAVPILLLMALNNRDAFSPSHWLHFVRPWSLLLMITRWRLYACFFLLLGAVGGLVSLYAAGRRRPAWVLAAIVIVDLGGHVALAWHGKIRHTPPPVAPAPDPPVTVHTDYDEQFWAALRRNEVCLNAENTVLRYVSRWERLGRGDPGYRGEFWGDHAVTVLSWSPNMIRLKSAPGGRVYANVNPGNYWLVNGERLFAGDRAVEPGGVFLIRHVPPSGIVALRVRPPHLGPLLAVQAGFAVLAVALAGGLLRRRRRGRGEVA